MNRPIVEHADPGKQLVAFALAATVFMIAVTIAVSAFVVTRASSPFAKACVALAPGTPAEYFEHSLQYAGADSIELHSPDRTRDFYADDVVSLMRASHETRLYASHCVGEFDGEGTLIRSGLRH